MPFQLDGENGLLAALKGRILRRAHALIAVAEGAGQDLLAASALWLSQTPQSALTAAVLMLVPGVPLINASVDILQGHVSAGLARATTSLVAFLGIALGLGIVVRVLQVQL